jgi:hypothetical protein
VNEIKKKDGVRTSFEEGDGTRKSQVLSRLTTPKKGETEVASAPISENRQESDKDNKEEPIPNT